MFMSFLLHNVDHRASEGHVRQVDVSKLHFYLRGPKDRRQVESVRIAATMDAQPLLHAAVLVGDKKRLVSKMLAKVFGQILLRQGNQ